VILPRSILAAAGRRLAPVALALLALLWGCRLDPGGRCDAQADCLSGQFCRGGLCVGCQSSADCSEWETCGASHVCVVSAGRCGGGTGCASYQLCDASHTCVLAPGRCDASGGCSAWEDCVSHACTVQPGRCNAPLDCQAWEACDGSNRCVPSGQGGDVMMVCSLYDNSGMFGCLAPVLDPSRVAIGINGDSDGYAFLEPGGSVVYAHKLIGGAAQLRRFERDQLTLVASPSPHWAWPSDPYGNDPLLVAETACSGGNWVEWRMQSGTGAILYSCPGATGLDWFDPSGTLHLAGHMVHAWTTGGLKLANPGYREDILRAVVIDTAGAATPVRNLPSSTLELIAARTHGEAFYVALQVGSSTNYAFELWDVAASGTATRLGTYATSPVNVSRLYAMDSAANLYQVGRLAGTTTDVVYRIPLSPGAVSVVFSEEGRPQNDFTNPSLQVTPRIYGIGILFSTP